jgi:hypothetical protein
MFDESRRWLAIKKLQKAKDRALAKNDKDIENAKRHNASPEEIERLTDKQFRQDTRFDDAIDQENTYFVLKMAQRYVIPLPAETDKVGPDWIITDLGVKLNRQTCLTLLTAIRAQREGRWRQFERWITWAIGLIGALTGLVAILKK